MSVSRANPETAGAEGSRAGTQGAVAAGVPAEQPDPLAEGLMSPNPQSIQQTATVAEAVQFFANRAVNAAPVIDEAGRPVGVLSQADLLIHLRQKAPALAPGAEPARVQDIMTPAVFAVRRDAPSAKVIDELLALRVHQLFVVDETGVLVGVVSAGDVFRRLYGNR